MDPCIISIFQYIFNKMQRYTVYLYPETALHVSGGTSTHNQEILRISRIRVKGDRKLSVCANRTSKNKTIYRVRQKMLTIFKLK
jgi:hypothetical protein